jgi:hypothetical protein
LVEGAFVELVKLVLLVDGVPDAVSAFESATFGFEDEDAVVGDEGEVDFGSAFLVVMGETQRMAAGATNFARPF